MDADCIERDQYLSRREKRWSMNSQRLDEIVAELMKPISDVRRSFDTDLSALLEEYLTEAGVHALEAGEAGAPNFAELALLLQHSASLYGRKVDFLYQHVLSVSDSLEQSTQEIANASTSEEPQTPSSSRRKRKASTHGDFSEISLEPCGAARRETETPRPPPTLPRMYVELEPRRLAPGDAPLCDYAGEPVGLISDFQVAWRLHEGYLVDELEAEVAPETPSLRPIDLVELQEAISAAAPPPPSPRPPAAPSPRASTPLPGAEPPPPDILGVPLLKKLRKRKNEANVAEVFKGTVKLFIGSELRKHLKEVREFDVCSAWISREVTRRKNYILAQRHRLKEKDPDKDEEGFRGWSTGEITRARAACKLSRVESESDDDGFFELSSVGDSDASAAATHDATHDATPDWAAWQQAAESKAAAAAARAVDVRRLGAALLAALPPPAPPPLPPPPPVPFLDVLRSTAEEETDVSRLLLATLFLANSGNVEIVPGAPLTMNSFSVRALSHDERLYATLQLEPATLQLEPATLQLEPATLQLKPATLQLEPATLQLKPATLQLEHATLQLEPATHS